VSSFQSCIQTDSRYLSPSTANNASTLINCTTNTDQLPQITVIDLRLTPGIGAPSNLLFNLSVVQGNQNGAGAIPSTSPSECQLSDPSTQTCVLTTPAVINVKSTQIVYRYKLVPAFTIPYCYGSVAIFEQYKNSSQKCQDLCDGVVHNCNDFTGCIPVQYPSDAMNSMIYKKVNALQQQTNKDEFKLNAFQRVQQPVDFSPIQCINFNHAGISQVIEYGDVCNNVLSQPSVITNNDFSNIIARQGNLRNVKNGWFSNGVYSKSQCSSVLPPPGPNPADMCRESNNITENLIYDNSNYDVRVGAFLSMPSIYGTTPNPIYRNLITSPVTSADEINLPVGITTLSSDLGSVGYACAGYECPANQDLRRIEQITAQNEFVATSYFNTINSVVALAPKCYVYFITPEPEVFAEVTIEVTADGHTETVVIDNFNPAGSGTSEPFRYVFGRIENIQTPTGIFGPSIQGAMVLCGVDDDIQFINMQCLITGVNCDKAQQVDLSTTTNFSETSNPWETIMKTSLNQNGFQSRTNFYPHPYDYIIPSDANGKDFTAKSLPNDHGQTFWYFVNDVDLLNQFGVDCNKIGMAQGINSMQQNANLFCNLGPHECTPGVGNVANGGLKDALPCKVSQYMNFASGLYDQTIIPFPYSTGDTAGSNTFIQEMKNNATRFMPNNQFLESGLNTTQSLYSPQTPQWWLGYGGPNSGGQFLYYSPSTTNGIDYFTNAAVELVVDVVGTFVGYTTSVSLGKIDPDKSVCQFVQGGVSNLAIFAENLALEGVGVATNYIITVDCNPPNQTNVGFSLDTEPNLRQFTLSPGENMYVNFTTQASSGDPIANQVSCIATMLYADVVVNASCSTAVINCGIQIAIPSGTFSYGDPTPAPPGETLVNCSGFCSLTCYVEAGTPWQSGCFWLAVIIPIILGLACIGTLIGVIYIYCYKVGERETSVQRSNQFVRSQETRSQEIITSSG